MDFKQKPPCHLPVRRWSPQRPRKELGGVPAKKIPWAPRDSRSQRGIATGSTARTGATAPGPSVDLAGPPLPRGMERGGTGGLPQRAARPPKSTGDDLPVMVLSVDSFAEPAYEPLTDFCAKFGLPPALRLVPHPLAGAARGLSALDRVCGCSFFLPSQERARGTRCSAVKE